MKQEAELDSVPRPEDIYHPNHSGICQVSNFLLNLIAVRCWGIYFKISQAARVAIYILLFRGQSLTENGLELHLEVDRAGTLV